MYIKVEELTDLCEAYPELQVVRDITANHGEKSEISEICELITHLYRRLDLLQSKSAPFDSVSSNGINFGEFSIASAKSIKSEK